MISQLKSLSSSHIPQCEEWGHLTVNKDQLLIQINAQNQIIHIIFHYVEIWSPDFFLN